MVTIMCLPDEVIVIILGYNDINIEDIINFICMWEQFRSTLNYYKVLEKKCSQRWPSAKKHYDKQSKENEQDIFEKNDQNDKKRLNFAKTGINCAKQLWSYVSQIIHKHYYESIDNYDNKTIDNLLLFEDIFHLDDHLKNNFDEIINKPENCIKYSVFIDEIKYLLTQSSRRAGCDLTEKYCIIKLFHYMRQCSVSIKLNRFEKQPDRVHLLERIATIVAQWIQPQKDVFYSDIEEWLNNIALTVLKCLRETHPNHSIFSTLPETFSYWKNNNIDDNHWHVVEGNQILDTLHKYLFEKLNFQSSKLNDTNLKNMCIDSVLKNKHGHELILLIIYHSVARRLGLRCDIIGMQRPHGVPIYSIIWKPEYATCSINGIRCFSINFASMDNVVKQNSLFHAFLSKSPDVFVITAKLMWQEMRNLYADLLNQYNYGINPYEYRLYGLISRKINLCFKKSMMLNRGNVKFAVGMIVTHNDQSTGSCTGVIIGWHQCDDKYVTFEVSEHLLCPPYFYRECEMPLNHCDDFNYTEQTNYIILTENNKMCYVGEDAITLTWPKWIDNSEIGRYFCRFEGTHYVPNKMLASCYPHDAAITAKITI